MPSPLSARIFTKKPENQPSDWRQDGKLVAAQKRLDAVKADLAARRNRLAPLDADIRAIAAELEDAELRVLAGRAPDSTLAPVQDRHLKARMAAAQEKLAIADLAAEEAVLEGERIPALRRAAKRASIKSFRRAYRAILSRLHASLDAAVDADADLAALLQDGFAQFNAAGSPIPGHDADGFREYAGMRRLSRTYLNFATGAPAGQVTVAGQTKGLLDMVADALAALDRDEAADASQPAESRGLV